MAERQRVVVVGQGYVGLPLAVAAAEAGHDVTGLDHSGALVDRLNAADSPISDVGSAALAAVRDAGRYRATTDFAACADADVVVLCVPTPYHNDAPDLSHVETAAGLAGGHLSAGVMVILESTTYPGTTEEVLQPVLEAASGLTAGDGLDLVFSPERIDPGNPAYGLRNTPKIVGGTTPAATSRAAAFYRTFVDEVVEVPDPRTAETAKLLENTFRHINIALVNELAMLCQDLDVDVWKVIDAAASKPFGFMPFYPGPGVGGHCIPVDPMYLSWRVRQFGGAAKFIELARDVNNAMPLYVASRIQELLNDREKAVKGSRVLLLGVTYKRDVADLRESPAEPLAARLVQRGAVLDYHDPHVPVWRLTGAGERKSVDLEPGVLAGCDCVVVITDHSGIDYGWVAEHAPLVFDTRNTVPAGPNVYRL
jgi:UDP-N-acetyl-D-glucosamine dehydrogenase